MADEETTKTSVDWFLADILTLKVDVTPELRELLKKRAAEYVTITSALPSWDRWLMLGDATREAFLDVLADMAATKALDK